MNRALLEAKRAATLTAQAQAACPSEDDYRAAMANADAELAAIDAWDSQADLAGRHGMDFPRPDPAKKQALQEKIRSLRKRLPDAAAIAGIRQTEANMADQAYRQEARKALTEGPLAEAYDKLQAALIPLRDAIAEAMGSYRAAERQTTTYYPGYGPAADLLKQLEAVMSRNSSAASLCPAWLTPKIGLQPSSLPGVEEAEAAALAWLERQISA